MRETINLTNPVLSSAFDGIIELRVMERDDEIKNLLRIRSLKDQPHDAR